MIKEEIRIIGWDDCAHTFRQKNVLVVGVIFRGGRFLDGMLSTHIRKDGLDATERIAERILSSRHYDQLSVIMLDGITFGGFNVVDIKLLNKKTKLPVIAVLRRMPDKKGFFAALKSLPNCRQRLEMAKAAGKFYSYQNAVYQKSGLGERECGEILRISCLHGNVPEPIRVAHLIASGLGGESRGRA